MFIGTHTLLPVVLALGAEDTRLGRGRGEAFPEWSLPAIGLFGALPDLCTPHLSLDARFSSWSHTLGFLALLLPVAAAAASYFPRGSRLLVAVSFWLAAALHLGADAVSGGICWLRPWNESVLGGYFIHPDYWVAADAGFVVLTWGLLLLRRRLRARCYAGTAAEVS